LTGQYIAIIDSDDLLRDPENMLQLLSKKLDLPFMSTMLNWLQGRRESDGVWAEHWYKSVEQSFGFTPYYTKELSLNIKQRLVVKQVEPFYKQLFEKRIIG
jgi:hypothetical protein